MFHPDVIAAREAELLRVFGDSLPGRTLTRRSIEECWAYKAQLDDAVDVKGNPLRPLTPDESTFITNERLIATIDYRYWSERYAVVAKETQDAEPLTPRWKSQDLFLARIAKLEHERYFRGHPDGILINVLKARQLGLSTETEVILAHRVTTQSAVRGLVAADVPEQSTYLFGMAELVVDSLPWWLRPPPVAPTNKGHILSFDTQSSLRVAAGKSQRGGLQDKGGTKGNIGRGKTWSILHLSEISTWERPEQIRDGLEPGIPRRPRTFGVRESTAKGRHDFWHTEWLAADKGLGRWVNIFIPWYIEPDKYWAPPPEGWDPLPTTLAHAAAVEADSPKWLMGETVRLGVEQLYWYESTRAMFEEDNNLYKFLEEYPSTPEEAFQNSGRSIFDPRTLEMLKTQERLPLAVCYVEPAKDIAQLKEWERRQEQTEAAP